MNVPVRVLGIESSCDETAAAILEDGRSMISSVIATQIDLHAQYGGVFPEVASRQHIKTIYGVVDQALKQAHMTMNDIDVVAVTQGPGLAGSLVVGLNMAKALALARGLPIIGVNHLEGHIYSAWVYDAASIHCRSKNPGRTRISIVGLAGVRRAYRIDPYQRPSYITSLWEKRWMMQPAKLLIK